MKLFNPKTVIGISATALVFLVSCNKESESETVSASSLYTPTTADTTANATLAELQQGKTIFLANCGSCHGYYSPESQSVSEWKEIVPDMSQNDAHISLADEALVLKYVTKGKQ
jgi:cytochrome c5